MVIRIVGRQTFWCPVLSPLQPSDDTLRLTPRLPQFRVDRRSSRDLGRLLCRTQMRIDSIRRRSWLRRRCKGAKRGRRNERAMETRAKIVRLRWLLARIWRREGLPCRLRLAQLDSGRKRRGRRWGGRCLPERMAVGGLARARRGLRLLCVV